MKELTADMRTEHPGVGEENADENGAYYVCGYPRGDSEIARESERERKNKGAFGKNLRPQGRAETKKTIRRIAESFFRVI